MSTPNTPAISVIVPVYNTERYLEECLDSILVAQRFRDFNLFCCDDASTDKSTEILERYAKRYAQMTILRHERNRGLAAALNTLMRSADGRYLSFCDSDDLMHPDRLQRMFDFLESHPDVDVLGSAKRAFKFNPRTDTVYIKQYSTDDHLIRSELLFITALPGPGITIRTTALRAAGVWQDEQLPRTGANDYDFLVRLAPYVRFANLPEALYYYREHAQQMSATGSSDQRKTAVRTAQRHLAQFGIHVSEEVLYMFHAPRNQLLYRPPKYIRVQMWQMIKQMRHITDFYGYPSVSPALIEHLKRILFPNNSRVAIIRYLKAISAWVISWNVCANILKRYPALLRIYKAVRSYRHKIARHRLRGRVADTP